MNYVEIYLNGYSILLSINHREIWFMNLDNVPITTTTKMAKIFPHVNMNASFCEMLQAMFSEVAIE